MVQTKRRVYEFSDNHINWTKSAIARHFKEENIPRSTVFYILKQKENNKPPEKKSEVNSQEEHHPYRKAH